MTMMTLIVPEPKVIQTRSVFTQQLVLLALMLLIAGCGGHTPDITMTALGNPARGGARLPHLTTTETGALLSWVEPMTGQADTGHRLHFATYFAGQWSAPGTIAKGDDWFINWADFPSVYKGRSGSLAAHWLQRSSGGTYSYDVKTAQSADGTMWSAPFTPHLDGTKTEHGFASYFSVGKKPAIVWLDGRRTQAADSHKDQHHTGTLKGGKTDGAMTLRTRVLDELSESMPSILLDDRVCDCCQTAAINASGGPVVFYRDRSDDEIRDISYVHLSTNKWSQPAVVHPDGWKISGCPVNGPQADELDGLITVAWFTGAAGRPLVKLAFTRHIESGFEPPLTVSDTAPLGRLDIIRLSGNTALVTWLEDDSDGMATIRAALYGTTGQIGSTSIIDRIRGERASGFLQLARVGPETAMLAYTDVETDSIRTMLVSTAGLN